MSASPNSGVRGPKQGHIKQNEFVRDDFNDLVWSECEGGVQRAATTRTTKSGVTVSAIAERPCRECTSSGCPWRPEYNYFVNGG